MPVREPTVYVAWFAPLALASADWRRLLSNRAAWLVLGSALAFAALSMVSHIGLLRWMFRLLPYYQFAILVLVAMALTQADEDGRAWNFDRLALVIAAEVWLAFAQTHNLAFIYLGVAYAFGVLAWISTRFKGRRDGRWTAFALATSICLFWLTLWTTMVGGHPRYPQTWTPPARPAAQAGGRCPVRPRPPAHQQADPGPRYWTSYRPLNTTLEQPGASIVGYSSMVTHPLGELFCQTASGRPAASWSHTSPRPWRRPGAA